MCRSVSWDLQSDDDERLFSLGLKAVTRFPSFFPPHTSPFLWKTFHFFPLFNKLTAREDTLRCGFKGENQNRALDFLGTERTITHVWERQKGVAICFRQHARYTVLSFMYTLSTSPTGWFSLGCRGLSNSHDWMYRWMRCVELRNSGVAHRPARSEEPVVGEAKTVPIWYLNMKSSICLSCLFVVSVPFSSAGRTEFCQSVRDAVIW